jgi:ribosomal protein S18 acetylase RimI-like enzyme
MNDVIVKEDITKDQIKQLVLYTNTDRLIQKTTEDKKRFASLSSYNKWLKKGRKIYTLVDNKNNLMGIMWFGKKELPDKKYTLSFNKQNYSLTFAIRIYSEARGKGLAIKFIKEAYEKFKKTPEYLQNPAKGMWIEIFEHNLPAIKTYTKFGFRKVCAADKDKKLIMFLF